MKAFWQLGVAIGVVVWGGGLVFWMLRQIWLWNELLTSF